MKFSARYGLVSNSMPQVFASDHDGRVTEKFTKICHKELEQSAHFHISFFTILRDTLSALDIGQKVAKITQREQDKQTTKYRTNFLSGNCQRVGFRDADSHTGRKFRSPLKYLFTAWEDQLIRFLR